MARAFVSVFAAIAITAAASPAAAQQAFRLVAPDGTVHLTNMPTDPKYRRLGLASGTSTGWLRLPAAADPARRYRRAIRAAAAEYGVPESLIAAVIRVESGFNPQAVSRKGARGLMQLMPATASVLGVRDAFNPSQNIDGGVRHLRSLLDRFRNNLPLALAAYNAGEHAVALHRGVPPYPETQQYVARILRLIDHLPDHT
ncbi:MAG: lytic transglycosylase domain-containing protein, partial [Candidatus Rokuibacteriota bacterium]